MTLSADGCKFLRFPVELVPGERGGRGPVKNKPIRLADGTWLAGASCESRTRWDVFVDRSEDEGRTWTASAPLDRTAVRGKGVIQPTLWESEPGRVHMLMRSTCGRICRADSKDAGRSWTAVRATQVPNNNSGLDLARLDDGTLALVCNPVPGNWAARSPLSILLSSDNGERWPRRLDLETDSGEFSYPSVVAQRDTLLVSYTWRRERVAFWQGTADEIG